MKEFIKKYYIQLSIIAALFVSIVFLFMEARQTMVMIGEKSIELKKVQLDRVIAVEFLQNVHIFKKSSEYIDQHIDVFNVILPNNDDAKVQLFSNLEKIAEETGNGKAALAVAKIDPKKAKKEEKGDGAANESVLGIKISFVGTYNDLIAFIKKIENMQYFSQITSFSITKVNDTTAGENDTDVKRDLIKTEVNINFYLDK